MKTKKEKLKLIEKAIDAIMDVAIDIDEAENDYHELVGSCKSTLNRLRTIESKVVGEI